MATVQLLDVNGDVINIGGLDQEQDHTFASIPAGTESSTYTYTFTATGLVSDYSETYIILSQNT